MTKTFSSYLKVAGAFVLLAPSSLFAQVDHTVVAKVPFAFMVSGKQFTPGTYTVISNVSQGTVLIRGEDNGSAKFVITIATQADKTQERAKLVFSRYGERYFFRRLWLPGTDQGRELPASKVEQELARSIVKPEIVSVSASAPGTQRPAL